MELKNQREKTKNFGSRIFWYPVFYSDGDLTKNLIYYYDSFKFFLTFFGYFIIILKIYNHDVSILFSKFFYESRILVFK